MHVILVHGMGGSPASWSSVAPMLEARGIAHSVADNLSQSLHDDAAGVRALIDAADDDVLLVGHSYGGAVISNAGTHPRVRGLVYVAAFAPDAGQTVNELVESYPPAPVSAFFTRGPDGEWIPDDSPAARAALAWDVPDEIWARRHDDRRVSSDEIFRTVTPDPAWRLQPTWYIVATRDQHIPVESQRDMAARMDAAITEVSTSHAVPHVAPDTVVDVIESALAAR